MRIHRLHTRGFCVLLNVCALVAFSPPSVALADEPLYTFSGLTLAAAETAGVAHSPDVAAARARVAESAAAYAQARAAAVPSLIAGYAQAPQGNPPGPVIASRLASAGLQITLASLLSASPAASAAAFALAASEADEAAAEATERGKVAGLYYDALSACALDEQKRATLQTAQQQETAARLRWSTGDAPRMDVVRAQVATARAQADLDVAQAKAANAREALRAELGASSDTRFALTAESAPPVPPPLSPDAALAMARVRRPELQAARLMQRAAAMTVRAVRAGSFGDVTLSAGYGAGTDSGVAVNGPVFNVQMTLPLAPVAKDATRAAEGKRREETAKELSLERTIEVQVAADDRLLAAAQSAASAADTAEALALQELQAARLGYRSGAVSSLDVDAAQASYAQAAADAIIARYDLRKQQALFNIGIGK